MYCHSFCPFVHEMMATAAAAPFDHHIIIMNVATFIWNQLFYMWNCISFHAHLAATTTFGKPLIPSTRDEVVWWLYYIVPMSYYKNSHTPKLIFLPPEGEVLDCLGKTCWRHVEDFCKRVENRWLLLTYHIPKWSPGQAGLDGEGCGPLPPTAPTPGTPTCSSPPSWPSETLQKCF